MPLTITTTTLSVLKEALQTMDSSFSLVDVLPGGVEAVTSSLPGGVSLPGGEVKVCEVGGVTAPLSVLFSVLSLLVLLVDVVATESLQVGPSHPASHKQEPLTIEQLPCSEQSHLALSNCTCADHTYIELTCIYSHVQSSQPHILQGETQHRQSIQMHI